VEARRIPVVAAASLASLIAGCGSSPATSSSSHAPTATASGAPPTPVILASPGGGSSSAAATEVNPAGDIPDSQVYVAYTLASGGYSVKVPEGWARAASGGAVAFTDHYNTVRLDAVPASSAPTVASARSAEVPAIEARESHVTIGGVTTAQRTAGTAILITYHADSPPDPVTGKVARLAVERYELWRGGTEAILTLSGPVGADNVDPWRTITDSFRWP
jgi:hypothetical protein